ncbi:hypothetical protein NLI96_g13164 [Meripilus lineatus]|uniref:Uncharacterized protein n=1 Tax=Meripilus lineatus TaxID=2056292 RepID=A0AAD5UR05_9APHY|nr:hypothetical protein NLI96_g13164 [Physisporinus lineatus]
MDPIAVTDDCVHGAFLPMSSFFLTVSPPNPMHLPFFTSFSPGVGLAWFVGGKKVFESSKGWTDVDKSTSLGNLVWPKPSLSGTKDGYDPKAISMISMEDVWIGGSSLQVSLSLPPSENVDDILWLPIQSLSITPRRAYKASIVVKVSCAITDLNLEMSVRGITGDTPSTVEITKLPVNPLLYGWSEYALIFTAASGGSLDISYAIGVTLKYTSPCPCDATITFGSLSTYIFPNSVTTLQHHISLAAFERIPSPETAPPFSGTLTWNISSILPLLTNVIYPTSAEDPHPTWTVDATYPSFLYFNIYVQRSTSPGYENVAFLGTTGFSGIENTFYIDGSHPIIISQQEGDRKGELESLRFWVQGVTDRGDVLSWDQCTSVEVQW